MIFCAKARGQSNQYEMPGAGTAYCHLPGLRGGEQTRRLLFPINS